MSTPAGIRSLSVTPEALEVEWLDGKVSHYSSLWLRDNIPADRDASNGQRLIDIVDVPEHPRLHSAQSQGGLVLLEWEGDPRTESFNVQWLARNAPGRPDGRPELATRCWLEGAALAAKRDFSWIALEAARADPEAHLNWLTRMLQDGIAFLTGVPCEEGAILDAMALAGRVLETNYGRIFNVRSVSQPENLAYSDLGLGLHTDNPYREPVPGFQALHVLRASRDGGENLFADGLALAEELRLRDPESFTILTRTPVPFHYRSEDADLYAERPLIQLTCDGRVTAVHYNNRSIAPLQLPIREMNAFYAAYRRFAALLREPRFQMTIKLGEGDLVLFDNERTLHGRTAFSSTKSARHLQGCYLTRDGVYSKTALLRRRLEESVLVSQACLVERGA